MGTVSVTVKSDGHELLSHQISHFLPLSKFARLLIRLSLRAPSAFVWPKMYKDEDEISGQISVQPRLQNTYYVCASQQREYLILGF